MTSPINGNIAFFQPNLRTIYISHQPDDVLVLSSGGDKVGQLSPEQSNSLRDWLSQQFPVEERTLAELEPQVARDIDFLVGTLAAPDANSTVAGARLRSAFRRLAIQAGVGQPNHVNGTCTMGATQAHRLEQAASLLTQMGYTHHRLTGWAYQHAATTALISKADYDRMSSAFDRLINLGYSFQRDGWYERPGAQPAVVTRERYDEACAARDAALETLKKSVPFGSPHHHRLSGAEDSMKALGYSWDDGGWVKGGSSPEHHRMLELLQTGQEGSIGVERPDMRLTSGTLKIDVFDKGQPIAVKHEQVGELSNLTIETGIIEVVQEEQKPTRDVLFSKLKAIQRSMRRDDEAGLYEVVVQQLAGFEL